MESRVDFLLDRNTPFGDEKAQLLDELTYSIKNNTGQVLPHMTQAKEANEAWRVLKDDHYFWYNADKVLSLCKIEETKVFMLVLL